MNYFSRVKHGKIITNFSPKKSQVSNDDCNILFIRRRIEWKSRDGHYEYKTSKKTVCIRGI